MDCIIATIRTSLLVIEENISLSTNRRSISLLSAACNTEMLVTNQYPIEILGRLASFRNRGKVLAWDRSERLCAILFSCRPRASEVALGLSLTRELLKIEPPALPVDAPIPTADSAAIYAYQ